ncbi:MAG TPA: helix-turn-helix domain-containing protein [Bacillota bacterium]
MKLTRKEISVRQKEILHILASQKKWVSAKEIGEELNFSDKTIQKDINGLIDLLPKDWKIQKERGKGYKLNKPLNEGVCLFNCTHYEDQFEFEIFKRLLSKRTYTVQTLSDSLYINIRSLQEKLIELDEKLKKYDLRLKRRPLRLVGSEVSIRIYWHNLIAKKINDYQIFKLYSARYEKYAPFIKKIEGEYNIKFSRMSILKLCYFIKNTLFRIHQGYEVKINSQSKQKIVHSQEFKSLHGLFNVIEEDFHISLNIHEKVFLFTLLIHLDFKCLHAIHNPKKAIQNLKCNRKEYQQFKDLIICLEKYTSIPLLHNMQFIQLFYSFFLSIRLRFRFIDESHLRLLSNLNCTSIQMHFKKTFCKVKTACDKWSSSHHLPFLSESDFAKLTMLIENIKLERKFSKKHALLIETDWLSITNYTYTLLTNFFKCQLKLTIKSVSQLTEKMLLTENVDFIISPIPLHNLGVPVILIDTILSKHDLNNIEKMLYDN